MGRPRISVEEVSILERRADRAGLTADGGVGENTDSGGNYDVLMRSSESGMPAVAAEKYSNGRRQGSRRLSQGDIRRQDSARLVIG